MTWVRQHRYAAAWLFAAALMLRVLIPAGWMPAASSQGWTVTLCSGAVSMTVDFDGKASHPAETPHDGPCAFGALAGGAPPVALTALVLPTAVWLAATPSPRPTPTAATVEVRGHPATGPPASV